MSWALPLTLAACATPPAPGELRLPDGQLALQWQAPPHDAARHDDTCKPWHDVYAPSGVLLTKGLGGQYPHHRGLFVGWNQIRVGGQTFDTWHGRGGVSQRDRGELTNDQHDLGAAWQVHTIDWCDADGRAFVRERRGVAVTPLGPDAYVLHVDVRLSAVDRPVALRGDPQHAGIQFRALQRFAEPGAEPVRYLRPTSAHDEGNDVWTGCPWLAAVLPLPTGAVTVLRIEHPANPAARGSTRPYGRFGAMYDLDLTPDRAERLRVQWVVADGERDAAWCDTLARSLAGR